MEQGRGGHSFIFYPLCCPNLIHSPSLAPTPSSCRSTASSTRNTRDQRWVPLSLYTHSYAVYDMLTLRCPPLLLHSGKAHTLEHLRTPKNRSIGSSRVATKDVRPLVHAACRAIVLHTALDVDSI